MDKDFERVIFSYLDSQDFVVIKMKNRLYYVNSEGDEYAQVRYHPKDRWCTIHYDLVEEIGNFFSLDTYQSINIINRWVENTLQMEVANTGKDIMMTKLRVENT